jgi:DNA-binding XRE family transcriptional regulator
MMQVTKVQNANRMMISIEPSREGLNVSFADGLVSSVPWDSIREVHGPADVYSIELDSPYEALIRTRQGEVAEIPWDFARHFCDQEYRDHVDEIASRGRRKFAHRLRNLRRESDLSQQKLAELSGVGRVTIARIEAASQSPRLETIQRLAAAMGYPIQALMMDDWKEFRAVSETQSSLVYDDAG